MTLMEPEVLLVCAALVANLVLAVLYLYGDFRRAASRQRSLALLLAASLLLGVPAGTGDLYLLNAIVIWSSTPGLGELVVAGAFGWAVAMAVISKAAPSQHDRLLLALALGVLLVTTVTLKLAA
jgi:hypothetical protein